jgi:hypothetical protein
MSKTKVMKFVLSSLLVVVSNLAFAVDYYCDNSLWIYVNARNVEKQTLGSGVSYGVAYGDNSRNDFDVKISINESKVKVLTAYKALGDWHNDRSYSLEIEDETNEGDVFVATEVGRKYRNGFRFATLNFSREEGRFILADIVAGASGKIFYGKCTVVKPESKNNGIW